MRHQANADPLVVALDATPLLGVPTGVGVFCREALGALSAAGELQVEAFAISWRRRHMLASRVPEDVRTVGRAMPARPLHLAWRHSDLPPVEWFLGHCDVVHGTNFVVPPTRDAASVVTVHDLTTVRFPEMCDGPTLRFPALVRRAVSRGAWVHTPSRYVAREVVAELGVDPDRVRAIHHGTPTLVPSPLRAPQSAPQPARDSAPEQSSSRLPPPGVLPGDTTHYILAIGTAEPRKDLPSLVRAFGSVAAAHRDVALVLAGPQGWGSEALADAIAGSPFSSRIVVTGYVADLGRLLHGAAVLAYPSLYEGFGLPTLEAMAAGVPVVTTTAGALPEVVGDAALLVTPGDSDALGAALERLLSDEAERLGLVERGYKRASMFTWEACAKGLSDLYKEAAGRPR